MTNDEADDRYGLVNIAENNSYSQIDSNRVGIYLGCSSKCKSYALWQESGFKI